MEATAKELRTSLGWLPYLWLLYLAFPLGFAILYPRPARMVAATLLATGLFLFLYARAFQVIGPRLLPVLGAIMLLGVALLPVNPGANVFFIYAAGFMGNVGRPRLGFPCLIVLVCVAAVEVAFLRSPLGVWIPATAVSLAVGAANIHLVASWRMDGKLRLAQAELARLAKTEERERIARDLHDLLGRTLSLIVLKAELAGRLAQRDTTRAMREIADVEQISRAALGEMRAAVRGFTQRDLTSELRGARIALEAAGVELVDRLDPLPLKAEHEVALALVVREAVTNVVRHASARRCSISLAQVDGDVVLDVSDDGRGGDGAEGAGLAGIRERVASLDGRFSRDGKRGTSIRVALPNATSSGTR